uniref:Uncharacterized protein n=1 Tax=uncultured prokaryote TaxID=198431 RepID=A0A0H5PYT9_9ZZZZ|nr:hypothetical protein [uncultured prokaryote]
MAGTRTAPAVTGAATKRTISLGLVDASGDRYSEEEPVAVSAAAGDIEGLAASYQAASNASLYRVTSTLVWEGSIDPDNAVAAYRGSVAEGINLLYKNAELLARSQRLIAPIAEVMQGNQDIPLLTSDEMIALITDYLTLSTGYNLELAQFTGRRERKNNPRIRV